MVIDQYHWSSDIFHTAFHQMEIQELKLGLYLRTSRLCQMWFTQCNKGTRPFFSSCLLWSIIKETILNIYTIDTLAMVAVLFCYIYTYISVDPGDTMGGGLFNCTDYLVCAFSPFLRAIAKRPTHAQLHGIGAMNIGRMIIWRLVLGNSCSKFTDFFWEWKHFFCFYGNMTIQYR